MMAGLCTAGPSAVFSGMNIRRSVAVVTLSVAAGVAIVGAALSPFALALAGEAIPLDWKLLADIGQTYGATSAIISALALAGVVVSVGYQARASDQQRFQVFREQQRELLLLMLEDPDTYAAVASRNRTEMSSTNLRRDVYVQLWFNYYYFGYRTGHLSERVLRATDGMPALLDNQHARRYWTRVRAGWLSDPDRASRRFARMVDLEYDAAVDAGPLTDTQVPAVRAPEVQPLRNRGPGTLRRDDMILVVGASVLLVGGWLVRRRWKKP
jgi:hypothetical protein